MWSIALFHLRRITTPLGEECCLSLDKEIEMAVLGFKARLVGGCSHHPILNYPPHNLAYPGKPKDCWCWVSTRLFSVWPVSLALWACMLFVEISTSYHRLFFFFSHEVSLMIWSKARFEWGECGQILQFVSLIRESWTLSVGTGISLPVWLDSQKCCAKTRGIWTLVRKRGTHGKWSCICVQPGQCLGNAVELHLVTGPRDGMCRHFRGHSMLLCCNSGVERLNLAWGVWVGFLLPVGFEPDQERRECFHRQIGGANVSGKESQIQ